jgi:hypothetical protein
MVLTQKPSRILRAEHLPAEFPPVENPINALLELPRFDTQHAVARTDLRAGKKFVYILKTQITFSAPATVIGELYFGSC